MPKDKAAHRAPCPECDGGGYVEVPAGHDARDGSEPRRRLFSGGLMRIS